VQIIQKKGGCCGTEVEMEEKRKRVKCPVCGKWVKDYERGWHSCYTKWIREVDKKLESLEETFLGRRRYEGEI